jgi:hypothetical protein
MRLQKLFPVPLSLRGEGQEVKAFLAKRRINQYADRGGSHPQDLKYTVDTNDGEM